jgi:hypothetical protein
MLDRKLLDHWPEEDLNCFMKYVLGAKTVFFEEIRGIDDPDIVFGELFLQMKTGEIVELSRLLIQHGSAHRYPTLKFNSMLNRTAIPLIERWNHNNLSGGVLNNPDVVIFPDYDYNPVTPRIERCTNETQQDIALDYAFKLEVEKSIEKVQDWLSNSFQNPQEPNEKDFPKDLPRSQEIPPDNGQLGDSILRDILSQSSSTSYYDVNKNQPSSSGQLAPRPITNQQFFRPFPKTNTDTKKISSSDFLDQAKSRSNM